jgi:uncharacterized repeat protein (TIGR03803 family)
MPVLDNHQTGSVNSGIAGGDVKLKTIACLSLITIVASLASAAHAQTFSVIYSFTGGTDGCNPWAGVTIRAGNLFGTTRNCGNTGYGSVYELTPQGNSWSETTLTIFYIPSNPEARVLFGPDGHLYGTTSGGIFGTAGIVFELLPPLEVCKTAACPSFWTVNVVHAFAGYGDGVNPGQGDLIWDQQGNIYGTTFLGGAIGSGAVYKLMPPVPPEKTWTEITLHSFGSGNDGAYPESGLLLDSNGDIFGTTESGGCCTVGTVFKLANVNGNWVETVLCDFGVNCKGGENEPIAGLIQDSFGNLYGATSDGTGAVFELTPVGNTWTYTVLHTFSGNQFEQCGPWASLTMDGDGNLYGTTKCDGANELGSVFKLTNTGSGWTYTSLYDFTGVGDGSYPLGNVTIDADGNLYGTARSGGSINCTGGCGTVWMIRP